MNEKLVPNARQVARRAFIEDLEAIRVGGTGSILAGITYKRIEATFPSTTQDVYTYKLDGNTVATLTVNYTNASRNQILDAEVVTP